jgi:hypothetical protein
MDVALTNTNNGCKIDPLGKKTIAEALSSSLQSHPCLNSPAKKNDVKRTFSTSRIKINEQAIIELYTAFSDYIYAVIREMEESDSKKSILGLVDGKESSLSFDEILDLASYEKVLDKMANKIFRRFTNEKSSTKKMEKVLKVLNIEIPEQIVNEALLYLDVRHLIIHNNSKADQGFMDRNHNNEIKIGKNGKIAINYALSSTAIEKVTELCKAFDAAIIANTNVKQVQPQK